MSQQLLKPTRFGGTLLSFWGLLESFKIIHQVDFFESQLIIGIFNNVVIAIYINIY